MHRRLRGYGELRLLLPAVGRGDGAAAAAAGRARARGLRAGLPVRRQSGGNVRPVGCVPCVGPAHGTVRVDAAGGCWRRV